MTLDEKIEYSINLLRKSEEMALRMDPENGFYLAFSGGKDSQALYHLAVQGGGGEIQGSHEPYKRGPT